MSGNRDLLDFLRQNNESWITAKTLAMKLAVSERTIKSRIAQLRKNKIEIKSSAKGYKLKGNVKSFESNKYLPDNSSQRSSWLVRKLIRAKKPLNVYDLSGQLYINEVELRKELKKITVEFTDFDLTLAHKGDFYYVEGKEKNKRKILSSMIYHELNGTLLNENTIQKYFPEVNVKAISNVLRQSAKNTQLKFDSFNFSNLLLHLVIMIDRSDKTAVVSEKPQINNPIVKEIVTGLSQVANYNLSLDDINQLTKMVQLLLNDYHVKLPQNLQINKLFKRIVAFVRKTYNLDLDEELFKKRFLPHLLRLITRFKNNDTVHNPLAENIKNSSPTIYECATLIAYEIKKELGITVSEEEIAFIALHVGNIVTEQIRNENKVICQLFIPEYQDNVQAMVKKINRKFGDDLVILNTITSESALLAETQLVIVVDSKQIIKDHYFVQVSSFLLPSDINKIQKGLIQIKNANSALKLQKGLSKFTSAANFAKENCTRTARSVIHFLTEQFLQEKIVDRDFEKKIWEREHLSSTAFGSVAIPHTINYHAKISQWFIYINSKGVKWNNQRVYLIIMLASSPKDEKMFRQVFDELSELIINDNKVSKLTSCESYQEFVNEIIKIE